MTREKYIASLKRGDIVKVMPGLGIPFTAKLWAVQGDEFVYSMLEGTDYNTLRVRKLSCLVVPEPERAEAGEIYRHKKHKDRRRVGLANGKLYSSLLNGSIEYDSKEWEKV
jgi:hypothetical protein